jgi:hypothetical protein
VSTKTTTPRSGLLARRKPATLVAMTALAGLSALAALGCEATFTPGPLTATWDTGAAYVYVEPPYDVTSYPRVWYGDRWVYLVDGAWYAPTVQGWTVLRQEPRELGRFRTYYEPERPRRYQPSLPRERGRYRSY